VAYHRVVGFDRICVYTNNCNDGTDAMLMRLEALGYVHHFRNDVPEGKKPQPNALNLADENPIVTDSDWVLVMDADEFLNVKIADGRVQDLVTCLPRATDAVAVTWRFFGSNGVTDWNPGLVTESYTRAAPDQFKKGWGVKTLFKPYPHMKFGIHRPGIHGARRHPDRARAMMAQKWVNGSGRDMPEEFPLSGWRSTKPTLGYDLVEMNHYAVKSFEAYLLRRMRGNVNNKADKYNAAYFSIFDRNEVEVFGAQRHAPAVKALMAEMLADAELAALYQGALDYHGARVDALRSTGEYDAWLHELREASKVPLDRVDEVLFTQHLPKEWQDRIKQMQEQGVPDKLIAKMIAESQTAKKGETRAALRAAAEGRDVPDPIAEPVPPPLDSSVPGMSVSMPDQPQPEQTGFGPTGFGPAMGPNLAPNAAAGARVHTPAQTPVSNLSAPAPLPLRPAGRPAPGPRVHIVSTLKNEAPYLLEWVAHYQRLGAAGFTLFSNDCTDGTNLILNRLETLGVVNHYDNPIGPGMDPQRRAYSRAGKMAHVRDADWV
ncbi:MAG: glycosyltransferase family 2 protein, partial [Pseudomonadota bacterium]